MNRTAKRISFLQGCFALALALVVLRAGQLQLVEGSYWSEQAESRRTARDTLEAGGDRSMIVGASSSR
jgi:cell division protein FtsI/penicillin-binding protein 2